MFFHRVPACGHKLKTAYTAKGTASATYPENGPGLKKCPVVRYSAWWERSQPYNCISPTKASTAAATTNAMGSSLRATGIA